MPNGNATAPILDSTLGLEGRQESAWWPSPIFLARYLHSKLRREIHEGLKADECRRLHVRPASSRHKVWQLTPSSSATWGQSTVSFAFCRLLGYEAIALQDIEPFDRGGSGPWSLVERPREDTQTSRDAQKQDNRAEHQHTHTP